MATTRISMTTCALAVGTVLVLAAFYWYTHMQQDAVARRRRKMRELDHARAMHNAAQQEGKFYGVAPHGARSQHDPLHIDKTQDAGRAAQSMAAGHGTHTTL